MFKPSSLLKYSILKTCCITDGIIHTSSKNNYMSKKVIFLRAKNIIKNKPWKKILSKAFFHARFEEKYFTSSASTS